MPMLLFGYFRKIDLSLRTSFVASGFLLKPLTFILASLLIKNNFYHYYGFFLNKEQKVARFYLI